MEILKKILQQTSWQIVGKAITATSTLLILGVVSRKYGEEGVGVLSLTLAFLSFFVLILDLGINAVIIQRFQKNKVDLEWRKFLGLRITLGVILFFVALGSLFWWPNKSEGFLVMSLLGLVAIFEGAIFITANALFQYKLRYDLAVVAGSLGSVVILVLIYGFVFFEASLPFLIYSYVLGWIVMSITALFFVKKLIKNYSPIFSLDYMREIILGVWPIATVILLTIFYFKVDVFLLAIFRPIKEVGVYNLAYQPFQTALMVSTFIMNGFYPILLREYESKIADAKERFSRLIIRAGVLLLMIAVTGSVITLVLSPIVINFLSGGIGFSGSVESLRILSFGFPAFFISALGMWILVTLKKYYLLLGIYSLGLVVNFLANYYFIPYYSYIGASWVTVLSEYLILILQLCILVPLLKKGSSV